MRRRSRGLRSAWALGVAVLLGAIVVASGGANNLFLLDGHADGSGAIVIGANGTAYVAWNHTGAHGTDVVRFCRVPRGGTCTAPLTLPLPAASATYPVTQPFPVFGAVAGVLYVVGPRYSTSDTVIWSSTNSGASFHAPYLVPVGSDGGGTGIGDVLRSPGSPSAAVTHSNTEDYFDVVAANPGVYISTTGNAIVAESGQGSSYTFSDGGQGATLGFEPTAHDIVVAYWNDTTPKTVYFYRSNGGLFGEESSWPGPVKVSDGTLPRLASGPAGLFLLSDDYSSPSEPNPTRIDVRKYSESSHSFGPPKLLLNESAATASALEGDGGDLFENPDNGHLYAVWPGVRSPNGAQVMQLWTSTNGGASWSSTQDIATGHGYNGVPRLAVANDGKGLLVFAGASGLEVAELTPLP